MKKILSTLVLILLAINFADATHLRGGEIAVRRLNANSFTVRITITVFTNTTNTNVLFGGDDDILDFGDGTDPDGDGRPGILVPEQPNSPRPDLGPGVAIASYVIDHTYNGFGFYVISYSEPNRNDGILNMDESAATRFYIESGMTLDALVAEVYESPISLTESVFSTPLGEPFSVGFGCKDPNNYHLTYRLIAPMKAKNTPVSNYLRPENISVNYYNGQLEWDGKFSGMATAGEFSFAVRVDQLMDDGTLIGYKIRDFQVIVVDSNVEMGMADNVDLNGNNKIFLENEGDAEIQINAIATGATSVSLDAVTELTSSDNFTFETVASSQTAVTGYIRLKNTSTIVRDNPYHIVVRMTAHGDKNYFRDISYLFYTTSTTEADGVLIITDVEEKSSTAELSYPNPSNDYLFFTANIPSQTKVTIYDLTGKAVLASGLDTSNQLFVGDLIPGTYLMFLTSRKTVYPVQKIQIK